MMAYKRGKNREQLTLLPLCLDEIIEPNSICRVLAAYVGQLDMAAMGFKYSEPKATGRPPYDPASMLMLYLYGYLNHLRSSRRLEAETKRNVEVMWLMEKLTPDDKTISNFRKDNTAAIKKVFRAFSIWCNRQGLYGKELVAVDGTKIRANSSRKNIYTQKHTETAVVFVDKKINEYMNVLAENDTAESAEDADTAFSQEKINKALEKLNARKTVLTERLTQIKANGGKEISTVDPDAQIMRQGGDGRKLDACYNVQAVVDSKNKLVVDFEVNTQPEDYGSLSVMADSAKEIMEVVTIKAVADKGYYGGDDLAKCEKSGIICYAPKLDNGRPVPNPAYSRDKFIYDSAANSYICPEGYVLHVLKPRKGKDGNTIFAYSNRTACRGCQQRCHCTNDKRGREISRSANQEMLEAIDARMHTDEGCHMMRERRKIVEHPFGTIKYVWGYRQFLCRGIKKTTAEGALAFLAYNLRRVFNIFQDEGRNLLEALAQ